MKKINITILLALAISFCITLCSCDNDVEDSPWKFRIPGKWHVYGNLKDQGFVTFESDGTGYCSVHLSEGADETRIPFTYSYTSSDKRMGGPLVITSTATAADYPGVDTDIIALNPSTYDLSPQSTERASILVPGPETIRWSIAKRVNPQE